MVSCCPDFPKNLHEMLLSAITSWPHQQCLVWCLQFHLIFSPSSLPPRSSLLPPAMVILIAPQGRNEVAMPWAPFLIISTMSVGCIMDIVNFRANIHLSVNTYHVCSFVSGLPQSGWYFLDLPFALKLYEVIVFNCLVVLYSVTTFSVHILL